MYMSNCSLTDCLMATKKHFFHFGSFNTKDGSEIRIWEDKWLEISLFENNIQFYIILFITKAIESLRLENTTLPDLRH